MFPPEAMTTAPARVTLPVTSRSVDHDPIDVVDRLAVAYLALPVLIFFLGWFSPAAGALLAVFLLMGLGPLLGGREGMRFGPSLGVVLAAAGVALAWSAFGGAGHFAYATSDWVVRDAVLRDLVVSAWPPSYGTMDGFDLILRSPVAYYLPAALLARFVGLASADFLLYLWTALGVGLFLTMALASVRTLRQGVIAVLVIVFFSGMDILGWLLLNEPPALTVHLEWWSRAYQYSSNATQLFWVPNHSLPGWLAAALFYRNWRKPEFVRIAPVMIAVASLWSPLPVVGLVPFAALLAWFHLSRDSWRQGLAPWSWLGAAVTVAVIAAYVTLDIGRIPAGQPGSAGAPILALAVAYVIFVLLEFGILAFAIWDVRRDALVAVAALTLLVLPLYSFGPGNDLVMRGSIPALMVLCLAVADVLSQTRWSEWRRPAVLVMVFCLAVGSMTAVHEFSRAVLFPRWQPSLDRNLVEAARGLPPHYVGRLNVPLLAAAMRPPRPVGGQAPESLK